MPEIEELEFLLATRAKEVLAFRDQLITSVVELEMSVRYADDKEVRDDLFMNLMRSVDDYAKAVCKELTKDWEG